MTEVNPGIVTSFLKVQGGNNTPLAVPGVGVVYSNSLPLKQDAGFGFLFQAASPGAVDIQVDLEQGNDRPATEGAADGNLVIPETAGAIITLTDTNVHVVAFSPVVTQYARLRLTGQGLNDAGATLVRAELVHVRT